MPSLISSWLIKQLAKRKNEITILAIFIVTFSLYATLSMKLEGTAIQPFRYFNALFELDPPRVITDMTEKLEIHKRTSTHPLYVLMVNPIGSWLGSLELMGNSLDREEVAIGINSFFGATSVVLFFLLFRMMKNNLFNSVMFALIFALSMSQLLLSTVPETFSLGTLSLIPTYILLWQSLIKQRIPLWIWIVAGVFTLGAIITNFVQTLICFVVYQAPRNKSRPIMIRSIAKPLILFLVGVFVSTSVLVVVQELIYTSSNFGIPNNFYASELANASLLIFQQPAMVIGQLIKHFLIINVIGPIPHFFNLEADVPFITFTLSQKFFPSGIFAFFAWASLGIFSLRIRQWRTHSSFHLAVLASILFNLSMHSVYGIREIDHIELFLYTGNFTFLILIFFFSGIQSLPKKISGLLLLSLLIFLGVNNLQVFHSIVAIYEGTQ